MREIKYIVIHCTATSPHATVESIQNYWKQEKRWKSPGYHYIISANGGVKKLAEESQITNGVAGHNSYSIHVSYIGGVDSKGSPMDTRTCEQKDSMRKVIKTLHQKYPHAIIQGHRDFGVPKACPSFDVKEWLKSQLIL
jgi:N-acetylmuramoyl-L-alanine amidase